MLKPEYLKLKNLFETNNNQIGNLICEPNYYNDEYCFCILPGDRDDSIGIDITACEHIGEDLVPLMTKEN
jgi:hypothetical protein